MISPDEKQQGKRVLIAAFGFLVIGPLVLVMIMTPLFFILVYLFGRIEDVIRTWHDWGGIPGAVQGTLKATAISSGLAENVGNTLGMFGPYCKSKIRYYSRRSWGQRGTS